MQEFVKLGGKTSANPIIPVSRRKVPSIYSDMPIIKFFFVKTTLQ